MAGDFAKGKHLIVTSQCGRSKKLSQPKQIIVKHVLNYPILC